MAQDYLALYRALRDGVAPRLRVVSAEQSAPARVAAGDAS
jgi:hypothetical protein